MFTNKNFLIGVAVGIAAIAIINRLPASIPMASTVQGLVKKVTG